MKKILSILFVLIILVGCQNKNNPVLPLPVYTISFEASPLDGGSVSSTASEVNKGEEITITATPISAGWRFVRWEGDISNTTNPLTLQVNNDLFVIAIFERNNFALNVIIEGSGVVEEAVIETVPNSFPYQTEVKLTAIANEFWTFYEWAGDISSTEPEIIVNLTDEINIIARFSPVHLAENGITIMCPNVPIGLIGKVDGVEYEVVDRDLLNQRRNEFQDLSRLCVSNVTDMSGLFRNRQFNQLINNWDVSNVTNMNEMFRGSTFNQFIGDWDVSNVTDMSGLFKNTPFNQRVNTWDVSNVTSMVQMFMNSLFNQPIDRWNVSSVTNMSEMFHGSRFNQHIGDWDVSNVTNMNQMFRDTDFNQPVENWNVSAVTEMFGMFSDSKFNLPIENWDVSNVTTMRWMFNNSEFNLPIGNWNVSKVTNMSWMFRGSIFNQDIGSWNVKNVDNMAYMFSNASFNRSISQWCVPNIPSEPDNFATNSALSSENKPLWGTCPE